MLRNVCLSLLLALGTAVCFAGKPKALVIMMDGTRNDAFMLSGFSPLVQGEKIFGKPYSTAVSMYTETVPNAPTLSAPNHSGIATGVAPAKTQVYRNGQTPRGNFAKWPHVLSYLADSHKTAFLYGWRESGYIKASTPKVEYLHVGDSKVEQEAVKRILQDVDAMWVYINAPDDNGHRYGFYPNSPKYRQALNFTRDAIGGMLRAIKARPTFKDEDWMVIAVSDHGGFANNHGMLSNHARISILSVLSEHYEKGFLASALSVMDVPATVLNHFGLDPARYHLDGKVIPKQVIPFADTLGDCPFVKVNASADGTPYKVDFNLKKGFSIYVQVKAGDKLVGDAPIWGNKDWKDGKNPGMVLASNHSTGGTGRGYTFNMGCKGEPRRMDLGAFRTLPNKEVGLLVTVHPDGRCYFMEYRSAQECYYLSGYAPDAIMEANLSFYIGNDGTGSYEKRFHCKFNGKISGVRIMERPLYPDEMLMFCRKYFKAD